MSKDRSGDSRGDNMGQPSDDAINLPHEDDPEKTYVAGDDGSATRMSVDFGAAPDDEADDDASEDLCGQTIDDFRILRTLGQGGMARVYLAEQQSLRRQVAVKVMQKDMLDKPDSVERFRSEAMAAAGLSHGNIVQVYTVGEGDGLHYIAMEYVPGRNLRQLIKRSGPLPIGQALKVMRQAASALRAAGEAGIVHRDIKPANIMISRRGIVKVADFGLSIAPNLNRSGGELTQVGQTVGTPRYMSPEQVEGRQTDHRSDLYSLGVTFYYLLAGRAPFDGETPVQIALQHLKSEAPSLSSIRPDLPPEVCGLVHRLISRKPEDRPASAAEVVETLRRLSRVYGETDDELSMSMSAANVVTKPSRGSLRQRLLDLLGSQAAAVRSPKYLIVPMLACLGFGLLAGIAMRPDDPLTSPQVKSTIPRAENAREQYINAMLAGTPEAFAAVELYWKSDPIWTPRARQQLLLQLVRDRRREREALNLMSAMERSGTPENDRVARAADFVLAAKGGDIPKAESLLTSIDSLEPQLPTLWQREVANARRLIEEASE